MSRIPAEPSFESQPAKSRNSQPATLEAIEGCLHLVGIQVGQSEAQMITMITDSLRIC